MVKTELPTTTWAPTVILVTAIPSATPRPTHTPLPSLTPTPSPTTTYTRILPTSTYTPFPTRTQPPPTYTAGANQLTTGYRVWTLKYITLSPTLTVRQNTFTTTQYTPGINGRFQFLRIDFECTTHDSLTGLLTGGDQGVTLVRRRVGFENIYLRGSDDRIYPVQFIGTCWLAAEVDPLSGGFTLYFLGLNPLQIQIGG